MNTAKLDQLDNLVKQGESSTVEFKKSTAEKDRACRTLCAFANGQGGRLVFGVTPSGKVLGQLVTDRTLEELAQESTPWNPWIANVFYRRGYIETWGRGTLKIASLMHAAGLLPPTVVENNGFVIMTFAMPSRKMSGKMSGKMSDKVFAALNDDAKATIPDLATQIGVSTRTIERALTKLQQEGRVARIGPTHGGHWKVINRS